jgi:signal transduction histidine kinase
VRAGLGGYVRARLHRRIFVWFGATILLSCVTVAGVMFLVGLLGSPPHWKRDYQGMVSLVGDRFGQVWDDPARRHELSDAIGRHMEAVVVPRGLDREPLEVGGPRCARRGITVPVKRGSELVGHVEFCSTRSRGRGPITGVLAVIAAGIVLWAASGKIARRLSRPLVELTHVAGEIGRGNLASRMSLKHGEAGEVGSLAHAVNDMAARIERQLADQRELLAAVSHEIRTPLSRIRLLVELSRGGGATPKVLDELDREVMEIDALVGELLASSRLDFAALSMRELDAVELARRALERASLSADRLEIEGGERRVGIHGDATLVARALANLLQNAERHGGGVARLRVGEREGRAFFEVEDRGPGFADGDESRVFESFYRRESQVVVEAEGARPDTSLGLGLALVRRIAIAHGGRAYAENLEEGGARVGIEVAKRATRVSA